MKKEWMAREMTMEIIVGTFVLMVFLGLGYFTIILSRETWFEKRYNWDVAFENVMSLRDGDSVVVRGMPVGKVKSLVLTNDHVQVTLSLQQNIRPHKDCKIQVISSSILGGMYLAIDEGKSPEIIPEGTLLHGETPRNLMQDAAETIGEIKKALTEGGIIENFKKSLKEISDIAERVNQGKGTLGKLLSADETVYNDLSATVASLKTISTRLERGEGTLGKLLSSDDQLYKDISSTMTSLKEVTGRLERGEGTLGKLFSKDDQLYGDLSATAGSLKTITAKIERGEGSLGKMVQDDALYSEMTKAIGEARAAIDDFRENTPVVTFTSVLFGAF